LGTHIFFQVTGQGSHESNAVFPKKFGNLIHSRFKEDRQIRSDLNCMAILSEGFNETAEIRIDFRCSACQVNQSATGIRGSVEDQFHDRPFHHLCSVGGGIEVTVEALLVAPEP
jgi:hypothetical protein